MELTLWDIGLRLLLAIVYSGIIGFNREFKNRPAGLRTHILVCVGSAVIALIQREIMQESLLIAALGAEQGEIIRSDPARMIAQVISGIGFLGAGTIIVTKRSVMGLTTAASLWAVAGLGIAVGMGYYWLSAMAALAIFLVLTILKQAIHLPVVKQLEIKYTEPDKTKDYIYQYLEKNKIQVKEVDYDVDFSSGRHVYTNIFTVELPKNYPYSSMVEDLAQCEYIMRIRALNVH